MTRQDLIHKWAVYALALLPVWLLDSCILPRFPLFGVTPMLLPLALTAVAVLEGSGAGGGFGLAVGLVWTLSYPLGWGGTVLGMTLAGAAIGGVSQYVLSQSLPGCMLCGAGLLAVLDGAICPPCWRWPSPSACCPWCGCRLFTCCSGRCIGKWAGISWRNFCCHCEERSNAAIRSPHPPPSGAPSPRGRLLNRNFSLFCRLRKEAPS